jgi:hypothetical protein
MKNLKRQLRLTILSLSTLCLLTGAYGQITPSGDAYTNAADPTTNYGAKPLLDVENASQTTYIQFDLSSLPASYTSANITKATLKLYVNAVTTAGSFNVDFVNGTWSEKTITASLSPALGTTIAASVPLTSANVHDYIIIDITSALGAWLNGTQANDGIALVGNSPFNVSFDSKENTTMSHPPELDIVFAGGGTITGIATAGGSGLTGGGTSGTLNLSLTNTCAAKQILQWSGSAWACASVGTGTITGVTAGTDLTGGGTTGNVTLNLDTTKIPQLGTGNTFTGNQTVNGTLAISSTSTYQPFSVQSSSTFGTWLELSNTSTGGHTWDILSAGGGNAEGAGNLGITDLTGASTIWLEGNVKAGTITASTTNGSATAGVFANTAGGSIISALGSGNANVAQISGNGPFSVIYVDAKVAAPSFNSAVAGIIALGADSIPPYSGADGIDGIGGDNAGNNGPGGIGLVGVGGAAEAPSWNGGAGGAFTGGAGYSVPYGDGIDATNYGGGTYGSSGAYAGNFTGDINVSGAVFAATKDFKIDHPLDPANKYLYHSSVESSEMMNIYSGNVTTDDHGDATVQLPEWFEVLNTDFRYQLSVIGQFAQAIVARKIENNRLEIRTSAPNVEVSWQVTGVRQDVYAKANPLVVEQEKSNRERGYYIHPELYGAPEEKGIEWARNPRWMQQAKDQRTKQLDLKNNPAGVTAPNAPSSEVQRVKSQASRMLQ